MSKNQTPDERAEAYLSLRSTGLTYTEIADQTGAMSPEAVRNSIRRYKTRTMNEEPKYLNSDSLVPIPGDMYSTDDYSTEDLTRNPQDDLEIWTIDIERFPRVEYSWSAKKYNKFTPEYLLVEDGRMVSFAAKKLNGPVVFSSEFHYGRAEMLDTLWHILNRASVVVGWNSKRFDVPHMDGSLKDAGYSPYVPFKQIDLMNTVKTRFNYDYNTLASVATRWGLSEEKMDTGGFDLWKRCMAGDPESWNLMRQYNIQDVKATESALLDVRGWLSGTIPNLGLWGEQGALVCPSCGSLEVSEDGSVISSVTRFKAYRCTACGFRSRSNEKVASAILRPIPR